MLIYPFAVAVVTTLIIPLSLAGSVIAIDIFLKMIEKNNTDSH